MGKKAVSKLFYYTSIALNSVVAVITLLGAFAGRVSPERSTLLPFVGLILPGLLLINLVLVIYWAIRWRCWVFIPLVAILGNWSYLTRIWQFGSSAEDSGGRLLTVVTYNVDSFGREADGHTCKEIAAYLKAQNADILCLQEVGVNTTFSLDSVKDALREWPYSVVPYTRDSIPLLQLALFSRYPIRDSKLITYPESRNCSMWCDIEVKGKVLRVFNNHLQTTEVTRNRRKLETATLRLVDGLQQNFVRRAAQAETLKEWMDNTPYSMLVCGDFNSLPSSYTYRTLTDKKLQDGFLTCGHGYMYTFRHFKHLLRIDYVLHSKELKGVDYFSPELEYSDHNPVVMSVRM